MKSFIYMVLAIVISITLISSGWKTPQKSETFTLQATGSNISPATLKQSAEIIKARLKVCGLTSFEVNVIENKNGITVKLPESTDISDINALLISEGRLAFFETYTRDEITELLKPGNELFKLLNREQIMDSSDPRIGCSATADHKKVDEYIRSMNPIADCKLFWGVKSEKSGYCLFALKTGNDGKPLLVRSDIATIKTIVKDASMGPLTQITLESSAKSAFAEATRNNINKSIAIVIDDQLYYWPKVRNAIEGGQVEVTGNFTEKEMNYFMALVNNDPLPLSFKIVK